MTASLRKGEETDGRKSRSKAAANSSLWVFLLCVCLLTLWFTSPGELIPKMPKRNWGLPTLWPGCLVESPSSTG